MSFFGFVRFLGLYLLLCYGVGQAGRVRRDGYGYYDTNYFDGMSEYYSYIARLLEYQSGY